MDGRTRAARALLIALLLAAAAATPARAQGAHSIEGRVALPSGAPPPAPVRVMLDYNGRRIYETFTDLSGRFSFSGLQAGTYRITAEGDGLTFETTSVSADVSSFGPSGQSFTQNIQLRPKAGAVTPPAETVAAEEYDPDTPERAREKYREGRKRAAAGKHEEALKLFEEALGEHAPFYAARLALAAEYARLQRHEEALASYRQAAELKPDRAEPYVGVGVALVGLKRYDEAIPLLRGVLEVKEDLQAAHLSLGFAEMTTGDDAAAAKHLLRALELGKAPVAHVYLANVYERTGEASKAVEQLEAYLREEPQTPNAEAVRGAISKLRKKAKGEK
jgi:tetratricopeptide (TPR) repeat protein